MKQTLANVVLVVISTLIAVLILEFGIRIIHIDRRIALLNRSWAGFWGTARDVHRSSEDAELIYELNPGKKFTCNLISSDGEEYKTYQISINSLGFRGPEFSKKKPPDVYRIFIVGASNTFGLVRDEDTYPAQLQKILNKSKRKFEVINAGVSGYKMSQIARWADKIINNYEPDLIILQSSNTGRRSFSLYEENYDYYFDHNPDLLNENLPNLLLKDYISEELHEEAINNFATYRVLTGIMNYTFYSVTCGKKDLNSCISQTDYFSQYNLYSEAVGERAYLQLRKTHPEAKFVLFSGVKQTCESALWSKKPDIYNVTNCLDPDSKVVKNIHPPSWVYKEYAKRLADVLLKQVINN
ncbi:MAG: SGNH/GDSL hydrolase family protein [Pseudobdellovibrio sp.]